jgi:RNA polymerase sigma-70 factor, ECF subfamily
MPFENASTDTRKFGRSPPNASNIVNLSTHSQTASQQEDLDLLGRIVLREEDALLALYRKYQKPVYSLALRVLRSEPESQQLLQEIFLHVWEKASLFQPQRGRLDTWLLSLTHHRAIDQVRLRRDKQRTSKDKIDPEVLAGRSAEHALEDQAEAAQPAQEIIDLLADLSPEEKQALELAYYEGYSQAETAELLLIPPGVVKNRIRQGMIKLSAQLKKMDNVSR